MLSFLTVDELGVTNINYASVIYSSIHSLTKKSCQNQHVGHWVHFIKSTLQPPCNKLVRKGTISQGALKYFRDEQCAFCLAPFKSKRYFQLDVRLLLKNENQQVKQVQGQTTKNINSSCEEYDACILLHLHSPLTPFQHPAPSSSHRRSKVCFK